MSNKPVRIAIIADNRNREFPEDLSRISSYVANSSGDYQFISRPVVSENSAVGIHEALTPAKDDQPFDVAIAAIGTSSNEDAYAQSIQQLLNAWVLQDKKPVLLLASHHPELTQKYISQSLKQMNREDLQSAVLVIKDYMPSANTLLTGIELAVAVAQDHKDILQQPPTRPSGVVEKPTITAAARQEIERNN